MLEEGTVPNVKKPLYKSKLVLTLVIFLVAGLTLLLLILCSGQDELEVKEKQVLMPVILLKNGDSTVDAPEEPNNSSKDLERSDAKEGGGLIGVNLSRKASLKNQISGMKSVLTPKNTLIFICAIFIIIFFLSDVPTRILLDGFSVSAVRNIRILFIIGSILSLILYSLPELKHCTATVYEIQAKQGASPQRYLVGDFQLPFEALFPFVSVQEELVAKFKEPSVLQRMIESGTTEDVLKLYCVYYDFTFSCLETQETNAEYSAHGQVPILDHETAQSLSRVVLQGWTAADMVTQLVHQEHQNPISQFSRTIEVAFDSTMDIAPDLNAKGVCVEQVPMGKATMLVVGSFVVVIGCQGSLIVLLESKLEEEKGASILCGQYIVKWFEQNPQIKLSAHGPSLLERLKQPLALFCPTHMTSFTCVQLTTEVVEGKQQQHVEVMQVGADKYVSVAESPKMSISEQIKIYPKWFFSSETDLKVTPQKFFKLHAKPNDRLLIYSRSIGDNMYPCRISENPRALHLAGYGKALEVHRMHPNQLPSKHELGKCRPEFPDQIISISRHIL